MVPILDRLSIYIDYWVESVEQKCHKSILKIHEMKEIHNLLPNQIYKIEIIESENMKIMIITKLIKIT